MYKGKRIVAIIPARGGSKGIPNKNIIEVGGKPLIAYTIETALQSKYVDNIFVTTDSEKIAKISRQWGASVPFLRPSILATDEAKIIDAVIHTLENLPELYDYVLILQPTQPLRTTIQIDKAIELIINSQEDSLVSVSKAKQHPILMRTIDENGKLQSLLRQNSTVRRQDFQDIYIVDGSIYINAIPALNNNTSLNDNDLAFITNSKMVDIDEFDDLEKLEELIKR
ncbi:acylneuraminate cytidylyltransferase family protein [Lysinibacillus capsici]|uniref:acylneuraminate cytidylyltransferase family protein n=1 Tax=Lysinibacillus capsici TaxID=2115968 RepID=UPI001CDA24D1|nr:acylneuraminate cytidylyltransferase family protein [Lysinibacillus capsici]